MTPAPLSKVLDTVSKLLNKTLPRDREFVLERINSAQQLLSRNEATRLLYSKQHGCSVAGMFMDQCRNCSMIPRKFVGVVMPPNAMNISELMADFSDFDITTEPVPPVCVPWGAWLQGRRDGDNRPRAEKLPPRFLERDIPGCGDSRKVTFRAENDEDCNLLVGVRYLDLTLRDQREDIVLSTVPCATKLSVSEFLNITLPHRCGWIVVETEDGTELGRYHPSIYVPMHEWFRLEILCPGYKISWRGLMEPVPAVFDTDMVPFSDRPFWELALKVLDMQAKTDLTPNEQTNLARIYQALAQFADADLDAQKKNFVNKAIPMMSHAVLATGRTFSRNGSRGRGWGAWSRY